MSVFKESLKCDIKKVFINSEEFGDNFIVDGRAVEGIVDENELIDREPKGVKHTDGMFRRDILFYCSEEELGFVPDVGQILFFGETVENQKEYSVLDVANEEGVLSISMGVTDIWQI